MLIQQAMCPTITSFIMVKCLAGAEAETNDMFNEIKSISIMISFYQSITFSISHLVSNSA